MPVRPADTALQTLLNLCSVLESAGVDYRVTGVTAVNFYGYGLGTNVVDIAVESTDAARMAVEKLGLPASAIVKNYEPYIHRFADKGGYVRIQGDTLGEPYIHPLGFKLHSRELLLDRLDIYAGMKPGNRVEKAMAFIAMTLDADKTELYKQIWNRL
jgi:hypothetical protein